MLLGSRQICSWPVPLNPLASLGSCFQKQRGTLEPAGKLGNEVKELVHKGVLLGHWNAAGLPGQGPLKGTLRYHFSKKKASLNLSKILNYGSCSISVIVSLSQAL